MYSPQRHKNKTTQPSSAGVCFCQCPPLGPPECAERVHESAQEPRAPGAERGHAGRCGGPTRHSNRLSSAGAWPSTPTPKGVRSVAVENYLIVPRLSDPPRLEIFSPRQPGVPRSSAPRAPALRPRPPARHLSSERLCQQPRLASWTTPKGTRGLSPGEKQTRRVYSSPVWK